MSEKPPKLFISYSWSNPRHEEWVMGLATALVESGVDVIIDKWNLREGHDAVAFMEQMVTDPAINKVVLVTDKEYSSKADGRSGGVGTEAQIISKEIYDNQEQDKFVAVVSETDEDGKPCLPTYYKARIYIDLSETESYSDNFEKLLRWIYGKPYYKKPELGSKPAFLDGGDLISLGTTTAHKRVTSALREGKPTASGALDEYLEIYASNLERFRVSAGEEPLDEVIIRSIEQFLPYKNEFAHLVIVIAQYSPTLENAQKLHRFFEACLVYMDRPLEISGPWSEQEADNYKFLIHELFLYTVAILLKYEQFELANVFLSKQYFLPGRHEVAMVNFTCFREYLYSMENRNKRLGLRRLSLRSEMLAERVKSSGIELVHLMQADFILFMRDAIESESQYTDWWPETLLHVSRFSSGFELFARSSSKAYFDKTRILLGVSSKDDLSPLLLSFESGDRLVPSWEGRSFRPLLLLGWSQLATKP